MRRGMSLIVLLVVSAAGIATAHTARLTAEEARRELYGVELAGVNELAGDQWSECIEPGGRTVYRRGECRKAASKFDRTVRHASTTRPIPMTRALR